MRGSASRARAIEISCRSPAERPAPPFAHDVVEAILEPRGDAVDADRRRGGDHLLVGRLGAAEADVVGDRAAEQERILEHDTELAAVRAQLDVPQVDAVDADRAPAGVVEAGDQLRRRRLAATRLADEGDTAARPGRRSRGRGSPAPFAVGEDDPVELEPAGDSAASPSRRACRRCPAPRRGRWRSSPSRRSQPAPARTAPRAPAAAGRRAAAARPRRSACRSRASRRRSSARPRRARATVAIPPRNSIAGKKTDESFCA